MKYFLQSSFAMLLLILFAVCLVSCAAQTTPTPSEAISTLAYIPVTTPLSKSNNVLAFLQANVQSSFELNTTTVDPILLELYGIIQGIRPDTVFSLVVKSIAKV